MDALHDDDDRAGAFVVEAGQQGVLEPFVGRIALGLGIGVVGLQRIVPAGRTLGLVGLAQLHASLGVLDGKDVGLGVVIGGPGGCLAQLAFFCDALVWRRLIADAIFELAIPLGQHRILPYRRPGC